MGSSTGMLVDNFSVLNNIFSNAEGLGTLHCEDEETIKSIVKKQKMRIMCQCLSTLILGQRGMF